MIYSCFDPRDGLYDYFSGGRDLPINADLPVPNLPPPVNGVGVPAIDAGRALPGGVEHIGRGWHARGIVVNCGHSPMGGFAGDGEQSVAPLAIAAVLGLVLLGGYYVFRAGGRS